MKKSSILIVEDEIIIAKDIAAVLEHYGYSVAGILASGKEALRKARDLHPDLVLMDIKLQGEMDGIRTSKEIRQRFNIPVVFLTAYAEENTLRNIKTSGAYGYILKPFNENELRGTIEVALHKHEIERIIEESEEKYRTLTENISLGIYRTTPGPSGKFVEVNPALIKILGYKDKDNLLSLKVSDMYLKPSDRQRLNLKLHKYGSVKNEELVLKKKNGDQILVAATAVAVRNETGKVIYFDGVLEDITETKHMQAALHDSEEKFRAMNAAAQDAIIMMDDRGRVSFWNKAAEIMFGYNKREIIGKNLHTLLVPAYYHAAQKEGFRHFRKTGKGNAVGKTVELVAINKDGNEFNIELSLSGCQIKGKWNAIGIVRDITFRKMAENDLLEAKEMAEAANKAKSEFFANMSHEIRTPMNGIIGMAELALNTDLTPLQEEYLTTIKDSAGSLMRIINDILDFSKTEAGKFELEKIDFNLRESLSHSMNTLAFRSHEKGLELICHIHPNVPDTLIGDPGRLRQIIINLVGNALKFTSRGEIVVEIKMNNIRQNKAKLSFSVTDTGIGIPEDKQQLIFDSFAQADGSSTRQYGGTGLGLAISSQLVSLMGGQLKVESKMGRGSKFYFDVHFELQKNSREKITAIATEDLIGLHAIVVDDNATNRRIMEELLSSWRLKISQADNGASALKNIKRLIKEKKSSDLIIIDAQMPGMDGFELVEKIKAGPDTSDLAIIIMSSSGRRGDAARCRQLGISGYLQKPVMQKDLLKAIRIVLGLVKSEQKSNILVTRHTIRESENKLHILLVEDNLINRKLAVKMLETRGFTIKVASHGKDALSLLKDERFDLILMDVQMPVMDGLTATAEIRKLEMKTETHIPIIALTAHAMDGDRERCLQAGMDDYVSKPFDAQEFFRVIDQVISSPELFTNLKVNT